jgi:lactoylglutathione lyase
MNTTNAFSSLLIAVLVFSPLLFSQSGPSAKPPEFDHTAVHVRDLAKSTEFYEKVVGLEKIPDPFKDGRHVWFRIGPHNQLHVIGGATNVAPQPIDIHFALRVGSLNDYMARLDKLQVKYRSFKGDAKSNTRPDGVRQIYFQDPDGYWIEVNDGNY